MQTEPGAPRPPAVLSGICIDCQDAEQLADFYSRLLGWQVTARDGAGWVQIGDVAGGVHLNFQSEPWYSPPTWPEEPGAQTKMLHLEIETEDLAAAIELAASNGATPAPHQPRDRDPSRLRIMVDPAGHPFCLFLAGE